MHPKSKEPRTPQHFAGDAIKTTFATFPDSDTLSKQIH
jgi:hypothetical protein